jgi:hypothetical protein
MELTATNRFHVEHPGGAEMLPVYAAIGAVSVIALIVVVVRASSDSSSKKKKWKRIGE